jgi:hypothetical protein
MLTAVWAEERDLADRATLLEIAREQGADGPALLDAAGGEAAQTEYQANTQAAIEQGVFACRPSSSATSCSGGRTALTSSAARSPEGGPPAQVLTWAHLGIIPGSQSSRGREAGASGVRGRQFVAGW